MNFTFANVVVAFIVAVFGFIQSCPGAIDKAAGCDLIFLRAESGAFVARILHLGVIFHITLIILRIFYFIRLIYCWCPTIESVPPLKYLVPSILVLFIS